MASTVVDDKSTAQPDESDAGAVASATTASCLNDPNYAIICVFLEKFGAHLKIEHPDFLQLQKMIENTDEVHADLKQFMIRLLRKTRKSVQPDKLDSALAKFCYTYSSQDAWEIERFGYKKSGLAVKLRILKEILESQFDKNPAFRTVISAQSATDLRSQPLGKDKLGNAYWSTLDEQCNLRIYQEHLDEEIWKVVATNRDEMVKLISCLKGNELVLPSLVGVVDEDSSSNSMPPKVDALQNGAAAAATASNQNEAPPKCENVPSLKIKLNPENSGESTVEQIKTDGSTSAQAAKVDAADDGDDDDEDESNVSEIDESSQAASESSATTIGTKSNETQSSKRYSLLASKPPSNKSKHRIPASDSKARINAKIKTQSWSTGSSKRQLDVDEDTEVVKSKRPSMMSGNKRNIASNKYDDLDDGDTSDDEEGSEEMDEELEEEEEEELSEISEGDVGDEIEEPTMYVRGEGSGKANKSAVLFDELVRSDEADENAVGEEITDEVLFVFGEGSGYDCDVGNNDIKSKTDASSSDIAATTKSLGQPPKKPMFFFGQAGCLKLSPMKTATPTSPKLQSPQASSTDETDTNDEVPAEEVSNSDNKTDTVLATEAEIFPGENNFPIAGDAEQLGNDVPSDKKTEEKLNELQNDKQLIETAPIGENNAESTSNEDRVDGAAVETDEADSSAVERERIPVVEEPCIAKVAYLTTEEDAPEKEAQPTEETLKNDQSADDAVETDVDADVHEVNEPLNDANTEEMMLNISTAIVNDTADDEAVIDETNEESQPLPDEIGDETNSEQQQNQNNLEIQNENAPETIAIEADAAIATETLIAGEQEAPVTSVEEPAPSLSLPVEAAAVENSEDANDSEVTSVTSDAVASESLHDNEPVDTKVVEPIVSGVDEAPEPTESDEQLRIDTRATVEPVIEPIVEPIVESTVEPIVESAVDSTIEPSEELPVEPIVEPKTPSESTMESSFEPIVEPTIESPVEPAIEPTFEKSQESTVEPTIDSAAEQSEGQNLTEINVPVVVDDTQEKFEPTESVVESVPEVSVPNEVTEPSSANIAEESSSDGKSVSAEIEKLQEVPEVEITASDKAGDASQQEPIEQIRDESGESVNQKEPQLEENEILAEQKELTEPATTTEAASPLEVDTPAEIATKIEVATPMEAIPIEPAVDISESIAAVPHVDEPHQIETAPVVNEQIESPAVAEAVTTQPDVSTAVVAEPFEAPSSPVIAICRREPLTESVPTFSLTSEKRKGDELSPTDGNECKKICEEGRIVDESYIQAEIKVPLPVEQPQEAISPAAESKKTAFDTIISSKTPEASAIDEKIKSNSSPITVHNEESVHQIVAVSNENKKSDNSTVAETKFPLDSLPVASTAKPEQEQSVVVANASIEFEVKQAEVEKEIKLTLQKPAKIPIESKVSPVKAAQSRTRKRRLSGEKIRLSSESENDGFDAAAVEPLPPAPDASSDDEVGGKRIKMRTKISLRNVRKSAEEKRRNQKESECSSDDNEKLSAKQSTSESRPKLRSRKVENKVESKVEVKAESKAKNKVEVGNKVKNKVAEENSIKSETVEKVSIEEPLIETKPEIKSEEVKQEADREANAEQADNAQAAQEPEVPVAAPRRAGRPPRKAAAKKGPAAKAKAAPKAPATPKAEKIVEKTVAEEKIAEEKPVEEDVQDTAAEVKTESSESAKPQPRKKKRSLLGLDVSDTAIIPVTSEGETPVRQSRRIAQIKIKEEAERRKAEEIALKKMKEASEKKKKGSSKSSSAAVADAHSDEKSASEEENSESEQKLEKKKKRKKENKERPWQTDSSDSSEHDEEEVDDHEEVERLPPLRSDHEFSPESDIEDDVIVPTKRARTARKDVTEKGAAAESSEDEDIHACQKCTKNDHPEWILLCDKCDKGYHCSCLIPVLFVIPEGSWFCPPCQQEKLIEELESKLIAYDAIVKQKEIEEAQRQRILFTSINEANVLKEAARKGKASRDRSQRTGEDGSSDDYSSSSSSSESEEEKIEKRPRRARKLHRDDDDDDDNSNSDRSNAKRNDESSAATDSDDEPIYKLRKRRQANVSYRFNEYDELINRAIKSEMDEVAGAGNLGRGKDISTIIEADKEEKRQRKEEEENEAKSRRESESDQAENAKPAPISRGKHMGDTDEESNDSEPIKPKVVKRSGGKASNKKKKKLNSLDVDSDDDDFDSDDDFKTSSYSDDEEEEDATSADSESSLEFLAKRGKKGRNASQRPVRQRKKRYDADFIDDNSDDDDDIPLSKKKKKIDSDFSDFNDSSDDEVEEDVDSEDLCDDSSEGSDRPWQKSRKSAKSKSKSASSSRPAAPKAAPKKKVKNEDERAFKASTKKKAVIASDDDDEDEVLPKSRRTRGKRLPYLLEDEFDSSDDGIKPGVKRPDTPPEERAAFIQKQEEIKRMLAEKNADVAQPSASAEKSKKNTPKDSLSTIPPQIIQTAKALDVDLKKTAAVSKAAVPAAATSDNDSNGFDDDLPEDFDPEDMDEDEIAKMMEEEEFAQQQLKLAGEAIRIKRLKDTNDESPKKEAAPMKIETSASVIMPHLAALVSPPNFSGSLAIPDIPPSMYTVTQAASVGPPTSNSKITTTPKKRGRKFKDESILLPPAEMIPKVVKSLDATKEPMIPVSAIQHTASLIHQKPPPMPMHLGPSTMRSPPIQQHTPSVISHSSSVIQHQRSIPPSSSSLLGIARNQEPMIPTAVLEVQNTRLLDPSELGRPPQMPPSTGAMHDPAASLLDSPAKKRGRRKKITPLRESLISPPSAGIDLRHPNMPPSQPPLAVPINPPVSTNPDTPKTSILSERLAGNPVDNKRGLPIGAQPPPPHLYAPPGASQTSVIRLNRPPHNPPFTSGNAPQQQRYYPPNHALPPPSHTLPSHVRSPYHAPNAIVTSSGHRAPPLVNTSPSSSHLSHPMYMRRGQPSMYGSGYPGMPPPQMHRALQAMEAAGSSAPEYAGKHSHIRPYQNLPFGNYYPPPGPTAAHLSSSTSSSSSATGASSSERRPSAAAISTFEQFDNVNKISAAERYAQHHSNISISTISAPDDERTSRSGDGNAPASAASAGGGSEFSGLVSYFSSQQDDLDT